MPRNQEFDTRVVLDQAMQVFWKKGYGNTSIEDLVEATRVNRYGLYGEFESKHKLFLACLDHYQQEIVLSAFGVVELPGASLKSIHAYFKRVTAHSASLGCLMANTASDVAPHDRSAAKKVAEFHARLRLGFKTALLNAKARGELGAHCNAEKTADFLTGVTQGLSVLLRASANPRMIANMTETTLACLQ